MKDFTCIGDPHGVPIYFQHFPGKKVSIELAFFVGSIDDATAGGDGSVHWFEHVPFRGSLKFPNGQKDFMPLVDRYGGRIGAYTGNLLTVYNGEGPIHRWKDILDILTDLAGRPLLKDEAIAAERLIIHSEITQSRTNIDRYVRHELLPHLWKDHPLGHAVIGTQESLDAMKPALIREAHVKLYDRSRAILVISGDLTTQEVRQGGTLYLQRLPHRGLSERRGPVRASPLPLPAWKPGFTKFETGFETSLVMMGWPVGSIPENRDALLRIGALKHRIGNAFNCGTCSPLFRIVREERHLAYSVGLHGFGTPLDGGMMCLSVKTRRPNVDAVINALHDVVKSEQLVSEDWYEYVSDNILGGRDMEVQDPSRFTDKAIDHILCNHTTPVSDDEWYGALLSVPHSEFQTEIRKMTRESAHVFVFEGTK